MIGLGLVTPLRQRLRPLDSSQTRLALPEDEPAVSMAPRRRRRRQPAHQCEARKQPQPRCRPSSARNSSVPRDEDKSRPAAAAPDEHLPPLELLVNETVRSPG